MPASDIAYTPILPEGWPRPRGFSHAVVATGTRSVRIAGQIGRAPGEAHIAAGTDAGTVITRVREHLSNDMQCPSALDVIDAWAMEQQDGLGTDTESPALVAAMCDALLGVRLI